MDVVVRLVVKARHPVALTGEAAVLNPLVHLAARDYDAYSRVIDLIDSKRQVRGLEPLVHERPHGFDKVEYQRVFMHEKRLRQRRAAAIENMVRPPRDALIGRSREEFMRLQSAKWKAELDARVERARERYEDRRIPKDAYDAVRHEFWQHVDSQLDAAEAKARRPK